MLHEEGHQGVTFVHVSDEGSESESEDGGDSDEEEDVTEAEAKLKNNLNRNCLKGAPLQHQRAVQAQRCRPRRRPRAKRHKTARVLS